QHRARVFIALTRSEHPVDLPLPRSAPVPAATFVDFAAGKWSPIDRPGRAHKTLARIARGREQHGARFLTSYYGATRGGRSLSQPIVISTTCVLWAVIDGARMRMLTVYEARRAMTFPVTYRLPDRHRDAM